MEREIERIQIDDHRREQTFHRDAAQRREMLDEYFENLHRRICEEARHLKEEIHATRRELNELFKDD
ncbi:DUF904 domain-containing protein [Caenorhabditis elegans]|uniref:DUF904 domain-containing protein n=2 Tax=Caenorhabditis elegans TaxID=6239 RepID=E0R7K2_CAEEL|nr:DUF904 domain-containing protein [Caenorhabditis elegans]CBW48567.1 DUF904 domain-containing protein [Caenorhabditis elegans]|eukprot:NP_001256900.1 Uncharacterized protein CELE_Y113G7B.27 [Caenorhabditis elegans]